MQREWKPTVARMKKEGKTVPSNVERLLASGQKSWYIDDPKSPAGKKYWEIGTESWEPVQVPAGVWSVTVAKKSNGVVKKNSGASLVDLGRRRSLPRVSQQDELARALTLSA